MKYKPTLDERIFCALGLHNWYWGSFAWPVWGRSERHCLNCGKMQYRHFSKKKKDWVWITFKYDVKSRPILAATGKE